MWHMADGWGWWMMIGWIWMVVFWVLIVWAVVTVTSRLGGDRPASQDDSALAILERRFAAGEISKEEFEERREILLSKRRR